MEFNDSELGLLYYNYRHYNPDNGRWISREREDNIHKILYGYVNNSPIMSWDYLGDSKYINGEGGETLLPFSILMQLV